MTQLGNGHLAFPLEPLPGEKVLWQGQAAPTTTLVRSAQLVSAIMLVVLFYLALVAGMFMIFPSRGDDAPAAAPAAANESAVAAPKPAPPPVVDARKAQQIAQSNARMRLAGFALFATMAAIALWLAWLQARNARYLVTSERICVQTGALTQALCVIDLDKILSVQVTRSFLERRFGLQTIRFVHAGGEDATRGRLKWLYGDPYAMAYMRTDPALVSNLLNHWLPRDDRQRAPTAAAP